MKRFQNRQPIEIDPVCSIKVKVDKTNHIFNYNGKEYYFCCNGCLVAFKKKPEKYIKPKGKGLWGRYLERLAKSTGGKPMKCH